MVLRDAHHLARRHSTALGAYALCLNRPLPVKAGALVLGSPLTRALIGELFPWPQSEEGTPALHQVPITTFQVDDPTATMCARHGEQLSRSLCACLLSEVVGWDALIQCVCGA